MADLLNALVQETSGPPELIGAPSARVLIGRGPTYHLPDLRDFPAPVSSSYGRGRTAAMYDRAEVEAWYEADKERRRAVAEAKAAKRERATVDAGAATKTRVAQAQRDAAAARHHAEARSLVGLPSEHARTLSLRRDLFDEDVLTCAPAPCSHWQALLTKAGERCDGRDVSPKVLAREREADRSRDPRTRLSLGHSPMEKPRAEDIESASRVQESGRQGPAVQRITLAGPVREAHAVGV